MDNNKRKIIGLGFLALILFYNIPMTLPEIKTGFQEEDVIEKDPNSSILLGFEDFSVNGTELYEDGIYYCFLGDDLEFVLRTSTDVDAVSITIFLIDISAFKLFELILWTPE